MIPAKWSVALSVVLSQVAAAQGIEVIHTNVPGEPTALVPGTAGDEFGVLSSLKGSPNGNYVLLGTNAPGWDLLVANGERITGGPDLIPWQATAFPHPDETVLSIRSADINDVGDIVFHSRTRLLPKSICHVFSDDYIVKRTAAGDWIVVAEESVDNGQPGGPPGYLLSRAAITQSGAVSYMDDYHLYLGSTQLFAAGDLFAALNPPSQLPAHFFSHYDLTPDGTHLMMRCALHDASIPNSYNSLIVDGAVVVQATASLPGSGLTEPVTWGSSAWGVRGESFDPLGNWYMHGDLQNGDWFALRNGEVIAITGDPIFPGSSENWGSDFKFVQGNANGDYVVAGATDHPTRGFAIVANQSYVVARRGDPVDLDGNGQFDDDTELGGAALSSLATFVPTAFLADTGYLYFIASLAGSGAGHEALVRVDVELLSRRFCTSSANSVSPSGATIDALGSSSLLDNDLILSASGLPPGQFGLFYFGPNQISAPLGEGVQCVGGGGLQGALVRIHPALLSTPQGEVAVAVDNTLATFAAFRPGATLNFQYAYRDPAGAAGLGFNQTDGLAITMVP